jgi:glycolate oxidase FAD binding subunit
VGGEAVLDADAFWTGLREQTHPFFAGALPLWRCTVPSLAPPLPLAGDSLIEWNGLQRWHRCARDTPVFATAAAAGGHATFFRHRPDDADAFAPLAPPVMRLHRDLKRVFDQAGILNPGRLYADL